MSQIPSDEALANRYGSTIAWREVDDCFTDTLIPEDPALVAAPESGADTTMPNAGVAPNQGAMQP